MEEGVALLGQIVASVLNNVGTDIRSEHLMNRQQEFNEKNMALAYDYNMEYMEKQHEMSSPLQQRKDLEAAGFSPSLMLSGTPAASTSQPSASAPAAPTIPTLEGVIDGVIKLQQAKSLQIQNSYAPKIKEAELKKLTEEAKSLAVQRELNEQQRDIIEITMPYTIGKSFADWQEVCNKVLLLQQQVTGQNRENELKEIEISLEDFKRKWQNEVGIPYSENEYAILYGLLKKGELVPAMQTILDTLSNQLTGSSSGFKDTFLGRMFRFFFGDADPTDYLLNPNKNHGASGTF